jgi:SAM-dependent methyltransferase
VTNQTSTLSDLKRGKLIDFILHDLVELKNNCQPELLYAVDENIKFFEAARRIWTYIPWLILRYPTIDKTKIKELADYQLHNGLWEEYLLKALIKLEKSKKIDLVGPLRKELLTQIRNKAEGATNPITVINVGCGAMEIERQILENLANQPLAVPVLFIGIDNSKTALAMASDNLKEDRVPFSTSRELLSDDVKQLQQVDQPNKVHFVLGDAVSSLTKIKPDSIDIVCYSKFIHHISDEDKASFREITTSVAKCVIEFDDYRGVYLPLMSLLTNWQNPILLNGAVFSSLRVPSRPELQEQQKETHSRSISVFPLKGYIKIYHRSESLQKTH